MLRKVQRRVVVVVTNQSPAAPGEFTLDRMAVFARLRAGAYRVRCTPFLAKFDKDKSMGLCFAAR